MKKSVRRIYHEVAPSYQRVNHVLTLGLDRVWRRAAGREARGRGGRFWLDICSGTGELAERWIEHAPPGVRIAAVDGSRPMLARARAKPGLAGVLFSLAEADRLPFAENVFDLAGISFASRNLDSGPGRLLEYFQEFHRVLRPGGLFVHLETSQPRKKWMRWIFHLFVRLTVRPVGRALSGSDAGYGYLSQTIRRFYPQDELSRLLRRAGFVEVKARRLFFGAAAVHRAVKAGSDGLEPSV